MRILLVNPPSGALTLGLKHLSQVEPLALEILGAAVPDHQIEVLDMVLDADLTATLQRFQPDVVGVTAMAVQTYTAQHILKTAKAFNPAIFTLVGGHHPTLFPQDFLAASIDIIVLGEGVAAFQEIIERRRQGRDVDDVAGLAIPRQGRLHYTSPRPLPKTLDHQPLPDRALTRQYRPRYFYLFESPVALVQTSMGCTFPCNFCSCQAFTQRHFIPHSPEFIIEDLRRIDEEFVIFCDDHSFIDAKRMERLYDLIIEHGIKKRYFAYTRADCVVQHPDLFRKWGQIGLEIAMTGLEAIDDTEMDSLNKRSTVETNERAIEILHRCGIGLSAGFVIPPHYIEADFQRIDSYVRARPAIVLTELTPLTPLPGTELYATQKDAVLTEHREMYDLAHFVVPTALPLRDMYRLMRKYYLRVVWRTIWRLRLFRLRYLFQWHLPRLIVGTFRVALMLGNAHRTSSTPAPEES